MSTRRFKTLFLKELKQENAWFVIGVPGLVGFELILLLFSGHWPKECLAIGGVSLLVIIICVLHNIVRSHTTEWARNTSQFLFSLPIRGWHIIWAKFCVQALILIVFSFIAFFALYFIAKVRLGYAVGVTPGEVTRFWLIYVVCVLPTLSFIVFPYILGRCFVRFQRAITGLVFLVILWGFGKYLLHWGSKLFGFLPEATITILTSEGAEAHGSANFFPGLAFFALFGLALLLGACLLLDRWAQT